MMNYINNDKKDVAVIAIFAVVILLLAQKSYYALIIGLIGIYAMIATALDILFGYTGQISLGHAGLFAIGAYTTTLLTVKLGVPTVISLIIGVIFTTVIGSLVAIPASKLVKHFLSLLMIAFGQIIYLIINSWMELTGGSMGIINIPDLNFFGYKLSSNFQKTVFIWIILAIILVIKNRIINSRTGNAFVAIRENITAARGVGIDVRKYKVVAFAVSAAITGLAGGLYAYLRNFISPEAFNGSQSLQFMMMLLFGGITTTFGPVIGAAILMICREAFQGFATMQGLVYAVFMLIILFFFPNGIMGIVRSLKAMLTKRKETLDAENR